MPATLDARMMAPATIVNAETKRTTSAIWSTTCCTISSTSAILMTVMVGIFSYTARCKAGTSRGFTRMLP